MDKQGSQFKRAIMAAKGTAVPIELIVKTGDRYRVVRLDYHGGLRYPTCSAPRSPRPGWTTYSSHAVADS